MASVTIDSGPVDASDTLRNVPQDKWLELMRVRRSFLSVYLPLDCRRLLQFVEDGEEMYAQLGFADINDFIKRGLELDPKQVAWALTGLRRMRPDEPIPYAKAIALGQHGGPRKKGEQGCNTTLKRGTVDHWLARLDRDGHAALAAQVRGGEMSADAAAKTVGYRKPPSPLKQLRKAWAKATPGERAEFLAEVMPP